MNTASAPLTRPPLKPQSILPGRFAKRPTIPVDEGDQLRFLDELPHSKALVVDQLASDIDLRGEAHLDHAKDHAAGREGRMKRKPAPKPKSTPRPTKKQSQPKTGAMGLFRGRS